MDSMLGYVEPPYKDIGLVPARMDDVFNFIPARLSALLMLAAGALLQLDVKNGWKIFCRDRCKHASPNSAQTESVCAGLLGLRLAGDAWYHGVLHKKDYIGDAKREIELEDIPRAGRLMYLTAVLALAGVRRGESAVDRFVNFEEMRCFMESKNPHGGRPIRRWDRARLFGERESARHAEVCDRGDRTGPA